MALNPLFTLRSFDLKQVVSFLDPRSFYKQGPPKGFTRQWCELAPGSQRIMAASALRTDSLIIQWLSITKGREGARSLQWSWSPSVRIGGFCRDARGLDLKNEEALAQAGRVLRLSVPSS